MKRAWPVVFLLLIICSGASAQFFNLELEVYNAEKGLSQNQVFDIIQDSQGFIWFATDEGLNRFDGYEFKVFRNEPGNVNSINGNSVHALEIDDEGALWIGTNNGICKYTPATESFQQFYVDYKDETKPKGTSVRELMKDKSGNIWIAYEGSGVDVFNTKQKTFEHYTINRNDKYHLRNDYITAIASLHNGYVILGSAVGIQFIDKDGVILSEKSALQQFPWTDKIDFSVTSFDLSADQKTIWISTELHGFYKVNLNTSEVKNFNVKNSNLSFTNNVPSLHEDSKGNLWIGGETIQILRKGESKLLICNERGLQNNTSVKNPVYSIYEDRDENIWFGTFRRGAMKFNAKQNQIMHFHTEQGEGSLQNDHVLSFGQDAQGSIWVGTDGDGLFKMRKDLSGFDAAPLSSDFSSKALKCIFRDDDKNFWIGTWDGGMMKYNPINPSLEIYSPEKGNFKSHHVWDIKSDSLDNLWVGTLRDGLCYFSPATKKSFYYQNVPDDTTSLLNNDVICLLIDSQKNLMVGTAIGVSLMRKGETKFTNGIFAKYTSLHAQILCLYQDVDQNIWIGGSGTGITILDKNFNVVKIINDKNGLPSNTVCSIQTDVDGNIWATTYNGLVKINRTNYSISNIPLFIGLQGKEFIPRADYKLANGNLLFGGVNGFNLITPETIHFDQVPLDVVFTSLQILNTEIVPSKKYRNRKILPESITKTQKINLSYQDYSFTVSFSPLTYNFQKGLHFAYKLEGLDKDWQYTTAERRFVHYSNLTPGDYRLIVKASYDGQHWRENGNELQIHIEPPWWSTNLFLVCSAILLLIALGMGYRTRVRYLNKQKNLLQTLVLTRTEELIKSNDELVNTNLKIETQKNEIEQINEELKAQHTNLEIKGSELETAHQKLKEININLEELIEKRTGQLKETLRELETFIYRASHDLRGPLSSMLGLIRVAEMEDTEGKNYLDYLKKTVLQLERTLLKLLQKHNIQRNKISIEPLTKNSLQSIVEDIASNIAFFREQDFSIDIANNLSFNSDRSMLIITLTNLLENAFFFSTNAVNKSVDIKVIQKDTEVIFTITDYGPGINAQFRDKIFDMFFRGHELSKGNGLGLYNAKSALKRINGSIEVETEEGRYSKFVIKLKSAQNIFIS